MTTSGGSARRPPLPVDATTLPPVRPRRSDLINSDPRRDELVALVEGVIASQAGATTSRSAEEEQRLGHLKRRLARLSVESSSPARTVKLENAVSKMKESPEQYRSVGAMLELFDRLALSTRPASSIASSSPGTSRGGGGLRSPLLEIPDLKQARAKSSLSTVGGNDTAKRNTTITTKTPPLPSSAPATATANQSTTSHAIVPATTSASLSSKGKGKSELVVLTETELKAPKNVVLQRWRAKLGVNLVPEEELLRDMIFLLQGINGKYVGFEEVVSMPSNDLGQVHDAEIQIRVRFTPETEDSITLPTRHLIHRIVELGRLYKRINEFSQRRTSTQQGDSPGMVMQSLCHFISNELTDYYRLIVELEAQLNRNNMHSLETSSGAEGLDVEGAAELLTLKQLAVRIEEATLRMRLISTIIESCQESHGGAIVSLIHSYTFNGDPFIRKLTAEILEQVSKPFFHSLSLWIFEGELQDPFDEFFVELNKDVKATSALANQDDSLPPIADGQAASSLWQNQFRIRSEMIPSFLGEGFAKKIFSTGKSLNFIRFSCGDEDWVATRDAMLSHSGRGDNESGGMLRYADLVGLQRTIDDAYAIASTRLLDILMDKFKLLNHLRALKDYLMLVKGDFIDLLMDSIGPSLAKPASSLYRHNLTASLETAIRGSNSQYDDTDIIKRLDARVLDFNEGDLGWDSFTLEYRVDEPVNTVLDGNAMLGYQVIFNHLWKIKRVELALGASWEKLISSGNMLRRSRKTFLDEENLSRISHQALGNLNEQLHFIKQMQGFINLEVIEYSWNDLCQFFAGNKEKKTTMQQIDLDELIQSHKAYLNALLSKVLLRSSSKKGNSDQLAMEVRTNLDHMLGFAIACDDLAQYINDQLALSEINRAPPPVPATTKGQRRNNNISSSSSSSPPPSAQRIPTTSLTLSNITRRIHAQAGKFQQSTHLIISRLEKHSNLVVRDLSTRLNFNTFYHSAAKKVGSSVAGVEGGRR